MTPLIATKIYSGKDKEKAERITRPICRKLIRKCGGEVLEVGSSDFETAVIDLKHQWDIRGKGVLDFAHDGDPFVTDMLGRFPDGHIYAFELSARDKQYFDLLEDYFERMRSEDYLFLNADDPTIFADPSEWGQGLDAPTPKSSIDTMYRLREVMEDRDGAYWGDETWAEINVEQRKAPISRLSGCQQYTRPHNVSHYFIGCEDLGEEGGTSSRFYIFAYLHYSLFGFPRYGPQNSNTTTNKTRAEMMGKVPNFPSIVSYHSVDDDLSMDVLRIGQRHLAAQFNRWLFRLAHCGLCERWGCVDISQDDLSDMWWNLEGDS